MDLSNPEIVGVIPELSREVFDLVLEYKGSIAAEHNDGMVRGIYLEKMFGARMVELFKDVKQIFDPRNIFNPHKKTNATIEFNNEHIDTGLTFKKVEDYSNVPNSK
jgi:hypothetical protein